MTYKAPRALLTCAMILALLGAAGFYIAWGPPPFAVHQMILIAWAPVGVAWAWLSAEVAAGRRNRALANGEPVPEDRRQFGRLLLVSFLALLALGETIMLGQAFGLLAHDYSMAPRAIMVAMGFVLMVWGDRRAKLVWPDNGAFAASGSARRERRAAWAMVVVGSMLAVSALFLPIVPVTFAFAAVCIVLAAMQLVWRIRMI